MAYIWFAQRVPTQCLHFLPCQYEIKRELPMHIYFIHSRFLNFFIAWFLLKIAFIKYYHYKKLMILPDFFIFLQAMYANPSLHNLPLLTTINSCILSLTKVCKAFTILYVFIYLLSLCEETLHASRVFFGYKFTWKRSESLYVSYEEEMRFIIILRKILHGYVILHPAFL